MYFQLILDSNSIISCLAEKYGISTSSINISLIEETNIRIGEEISHCNPSWPTSHFPEVQYHLVRPNKIISVFRETVLKILERVGTHFISSPEPLAQDELL